MAESVNRIGFPRSGDFLSFLKMYSALDAVQRKNVYISPGNEPGLFNYCVFPTVVTLTPECERLMTTANAVAEIMAQGSRVPPSAE